MVQRSQPPKTERAILLKVGPHATHKEVTELTVKFLDSLSHCEYRYCPPLDSPRDSSELEMVFWAQSWTRQARRSADSIPCNNSEPILMTRLEILTRPERDAGLLVKLHWTYGRRSVVFESLAMSLFDSLRSALL